MFVIFGVMQIKKLKDNYIEKTVNTLIKTKNNICDNIENGVCDNNESNKETLYKNNQ